MVWKILRPRAWMLYRQFWLVPPLRRATNGLFIILLLAGIGYGLSWLGARLSGPAGIGLLAAFLPTAAFALLFFGMIQIMDTLYQLFLSPDLPWVLRAPLAYPAIFIAKLIESTFLIWLPVAFASAVMVTLGIAQSAPLPFYPLAVVEIISLAVGASAFEMIVVSVLARIIAPKRLPELLPACIGLVSMGSVLAQQGMMRRIAQAQTGIQALLASLLDVPRMALVALVLAGAALAVTGLAYLVFRTVYFDVYSRMQVASPGAKSARTRSGAAQPGKAAGLGRLLPAPYRTLLRKEWTTLVRDPRQLTNLFLLPLMMLVILAPMFVMGNPLRPLIFWMLLVYASSSAMNSGMGLSLTSFVLEGRRFVWLRITPIKMSALLWSKFWMSWVPVSVPWVVFIIAGGLLLGLPGWQIAALTASVVLGMAGTCAVCVAVSAHEANFSTSVNNPKLTGPAGWGALGLSLISHLMAMALVSGLVLRWAGTSEVVVITRNALNAIPGLGWVGSTGGIPFLLAGLVTILPFGYVVWNLWSSAVARLERWEMV